METYTRDEIKKDERLLALLKTISSNHRINLSTRKKLLINSNPDLCAIDRQFGELILKGNVMLYISYDTSTYYNVKKQRFDIKIDTITLYTDYLEYEIKRVREAHAHPESAEGINLN